MKVFGAWLGGQALFLSFFAVPTKTMVIRDEQTKKKEEENAHRLLERLAR